ncbi:hypothetical protein AYJ54_00515 [Bradyrhizobium centrolobii]|uniref:Uncharacterized protein n=2 Tax=Bradyrhizobium centrolobii TaxID=1505087 RepID=A0A176YFL1_9BRAD|nr:hypothetical protein AYJ54_00515 [Bradyrhizobium centrolobii]
MWITIYVERALYVDRGKNVIVCDRDIVGREGGTLILKLKGTEMSIDLATLDSMRQAKLNELSTVFEMVKNNETSRESGVLSLRAERLLVEEVELLRNQVALLEASLDQAIKVPA